MPSTSRSTVAAGRRYWQASRSPRYSLLFALPLLLLYEGLAAALSDRAGGVRNGADVMLQQLFAAVAGSYGGILFGALLIGGSLWLVVRDLRAHGGGLDGSVFVAMLAESVVLAALLGIVVGTLTMRLLHPFAAVIVADPIRRAGPAMRLMLSLGAGLYEELLFRVVLVSALAIAARTLFGWRPRAAGIFATLAGATLFSAAHYIGPFGDPLKLQSFVFRLLSGLAFSALYLQRGFGITAWTHALYDVMVLLG